MKGPIPFILQPARVADAAGLTEVWLRVETVHSLMAAQRWLADHCVEVRYNDDGAQCTGWVSPPAGLFVG